MAVDTGGYWPTIDDLSAFGQGRLEDDFQAALKREKCGRTDFGAGWIALAMRHRLWSYFKDDIAALLKEQHGSSIG